MKWISVACILAVSTMVHAQVVAPPESNSKTAKFLSTPGLVFVTDAKDLGSFKVNESLFGDVVISVKVTAVVIWDYTLPEQRQKAIRFRTMGFYAGFELDLFVDSDEVSELQKFFTIFDLEAAQFKPSKDYWRRVAFTSRGGLSFALEAYDAKRDLRIGVFDRSVYMLSKDREKMKATIDAGKKWLDEYLPK